MKSKEKRLKKLEGQAPAQPVFVEWKGGRRWTEEEKAEMIRRYPKAKVIWMSLAEAFDLKSGGHPS
jgi:transposase-like protein